MAVVAGLGARRESQMGYADYQKLREIGSGSFGRVHLVQVLVGHSVRLPADRKHLVMKEIDLSRIEARDRHHAEVEVKVLSSLKHPYIVRYWESFMHERALCIIMDHCEGGDLWQYLSQVRKQRATVAEPQVVRWFTQLCLALKYTHERHIVHRDIKSQNVFLTRREARGGSSGGSSARGGGGAKSCVKLADFGIARVLESKDHFARTLVGTPYYLSPEMCQKQPYACPSDVWAVGCVLYEICALRVPFEGQDIAQLVERIVRGPLPRLPPAYSRELSDIAADLLSRDVSKRPTAVTVLHKPIVQKEIKTMLAESKKENAGGAGGSGNAGGGVGASEEPRAGPDAPAAACERGGSAAAPRPGSARAGRPVAQPLGEHNPRAASPGGGQRGSSPGGPRAPSPQRVAAKDVLNNRPPSAPPRARRSDPPWGARRSLAGLLRNGGA